MNFELLVQSIADIHKRTLQAATKAVNTGLSIRNWLIGAYIVEFEQHGEDSAKYGERLLPSLSERLCQGGLPRTDERELRRFRQFYLTYPQIRDSVSPEFALPRALPGKRDSASPVSELSSQLLLNRLSFTHFRALLDIDDQLKRNFYEIE